MEWGAGGISFLKPKKGPRKSSHQIIFKNLSNVPRNVTIGRPLYAHRSPELMTLTGSFHVDGEYPRLQPFVMVEDVK
jgi:hypothetical protein